MGEQNKVKIPENKLLQGLTTISLACMFLFALLITYLGTFGGDLLFISWHPFLLSTGWLLSMSLSISALSRHNVFTSSLSKLVRMRVHWILQLVALVCISAGMTVMYTFKDAENHPHYNTWHGLLGLSSGIGAWLSSLGGVLALYHHSLRDYIHPKYTKRLHVIGGTFTYFLGGITLNLSLFTKWFATFSGESNVIFALAFILLNVAFWTTLSRPVIGIVRKLTSVERKVN